MKIFYKKSQLVIDAIYNILDVVEGAISTRQMYYQLISIRVVPLTSVEYNKVQRLLVDLRREGLIPQNRICDRTRNKHNRPSWNRLNDMLDVCRIQYWDFPLLPEIDNVDNTNANEMTLISFFPTTKQNNAWRHMVSPMYRNHWDIWRSSSPNRYGHTTQVDRSVRAEWVGAHHKSVAVMYERRKEGNKRKM